MRARLRAAAVDEHRTRTALTGIAADVRAGETKLFAEEVHEQHPRINGGLARPAVDGH